jgi:hypothetical protein
MSAQLDFFAELDAPQARRTDPETSHAAAAQAKELQAKHQRIIVAALEQFGPAGKDRLAALTCLTGTQIARRTVELERAGVIRWTGRKVSSTAGRLEREWCKA